MALAEFIDSTSSQLSARGLLRRLWRLASDMRFGLDKFTLAVSMTAALNAKNGCPDYSTYSQVRTTYDADNCV